MDRKDMTPTPGETPQGQPVVSISRKGYGGTIISRSIMPMVSPLR
jgi:hypothetical protein